MIYKYKKLLQKERKDGKFWPSFTDLLTTILLCFILIFMMMMVIKSIQVKEMKETIDQIMGVREGLVSDLVAEFKDADDLLEIDEKTGSITFQTEILFAYDQSELKPDSFIFLDEFIPQYLDILLKNDYEKYVAEIIIEGHTDRDGSYLYNLELAQERALSVASYILSDEFPYRHVQDQLKERLTVNSKSYSDYKIDEEGNYHAARSRRVEFKFRLKDEEILNKTRELLHGS